MIWSIIAFAAGLAIGRASLRSGAVIKNFRVPNKKDTETILNLFDEYEQVTNSEVREALDVSEATAVRYLDRLEARGLITQQGKTGRSTFYTKNN